MQGIAVDPKAVLLKLWKDGLQLLAGSPVAGLTRTSLRIQGLRDDVADRRLERVLQRVPGVLIVAVDSTNGYVNVDHDAAVTMASLLAGVGDAGCVATLLRPPSVGVSGASVVTPSPAARSMMLLWIAVYGSATVALWLPSGPYRQWLLLAGVITFWTIYLAGIGFKRNR
jgi:hypothetical protein